MLMNPLPFDSGFHHHPPESLVLVFQLDDNLNCSFYPKILITSILLHFLCSVFKVHSLPIIMLSP